eukprot:10319642-Karenia_brevis.AAC.1
MRTQLEQLPTQTTLPRSPRLKFRKTSNKLGKTGQTQRDPGNAVWYPRRFQRQLHIHKHPFGA